MTRLNTKPSQITWKQNLRKIPDNIRAKVASLASDDIVVSCLMRLKTEDIRSGKYRHVGITVTDSKVCSLNEIVPNPRIGIYSRRNVQGYDVVHKDKPKITKTWSIESPNYGDTDKGYHSVDFSKEVYPRENYPPKLLSIRVDLIAEELSGQAFVFKFVVQEVLNRRTTNFEHNLFFNLNLLQEIIGNHDVFESESSLDEYVKTLYVNWEILPPGDQEQALLRILGNQTKDPRTRSRIVERYNILSSLHPKNFIYGTNEFRRYFGAQFAEDFVVFENIEYGNAIYIMFENWEELSKKSRIELLSSNSTDFMRILHTKTWKKRLRATVYEQMKQRR